MNELKCVFCGSTKDTKIRKRKKFEGKAICQKHMAQIWKYGKVKQRTTRDKNEFILKDGYYEFICYDVKSNESGRGKISIEDYDLVKNYKWHMDEVGRVSARNKDNKGIPIRMHVLIMNRFGKNDGFEIDHRNRVQSDNRRENLFVVSSSENGINRGRQSNNSSGYIGVSKDNKKEGCWRAYIKINNKQTIKGGFETKEQALIQRLKWEYEIFDSQLAPQKHLFKEYGIGDEDTDV